MSFRLSAERAGRGWPTVAAEERFGYPESGLEDYIKEYEVQINEEYTSIEEGIVVKLENVDLPAAIVPEEIQDNMISVLMACQNGVMRMIPTVPDTVETSSNLAIVTIGGGKADVRILARSSISKSCTIRVSNLLALPRP